MALMSDRSIDEWLRQYEQSHQHPINRLCHTVGIPMIAAAVLAVIPSVFFPALGWLAAALFVVGWALQFIGHAFEGKPPEFFKDWRFLFVGLRWWLWKMGLRRAPAGGAQGSTQ